MKGMTQRNLLTSLVYMLLMREMPADRVMNVLAMAAGAARRGGVRQEAVYNRQIAELAERLVEETLKPPMKADSKTRRRRR